MTGANRNWVWAFTALVGAYAGSAHAQGGPAAVSVYRCPGPPVLYTDAISVQEAKERGCKSIEGTPITVVQGGKPKAAAGVQAAAPAAQRSSDAKIEASAQKARDSDAKRILEAELRREEERLASLMKEFNNSEPERRGDERNAQKYLERVAEMKAGISRKEADVAAIRRELSKFP